MESAETTYRKGHIHGHPVWGSFKDITRDTLGFLDLAKTEGDIVSFRLAHRRVFGLHHPDLVKDVLLSRSDIFQKTGIYNRIRPVFRNGILTSRGEFWKKQRRIIQPSFTQKHLKTMMSTMESELFQARDEILEAGRDGGEVDVFQEMLKISMRIIVATMFSDDMKDGHDKVSEAIYFLNGYMARQIYAVAPLPAWVPTRDNRAYRKAMGYLDDLVMRMIERRQAADDLGTDLLGMLLSSKDPETDERMSISQVLDEAVTIFIAGHETTATMLAWAYYLMNRNPEVREKMLAEIDRAISDAVGPVSEESIRSLDYLENIFKETNRIYPPVAVFYRNVEEDCELGGCELKRGDSVYVAPYVTHHNPEYWNAPEKFEPERFERDEIGHKNPYIFFPFGGGPRICIGRHFALLEARYALAIMGKALTFECDPSYYAEPEALVTLKPRDPLMMRVVLRD